MELPQLDGVLSSKSYSEHELSPSPVIPAITNANAPSLFLVCLANDVPPDDSEKYLIAIDIKLLIL